MFRYTKLQGHISKLTVASLSWCHLVR